MENEWKMDHESRCISFGLGKTENPLLSTQNYGARLEMQNWDWKVLLLGGS